MKKEDICKLRQHIGKFIVAVITKLQERCSLKYNIVKGASCLNSKVLKSSRNPGRLYLALKEFVACKRMSGEDADKVKDAYLTQAYQ